MQSQQLQPGSQRHCASLQRSGTPKSERIRPTKQSYLFTQIRLGNKTAIRWLRYPFPADIQLKLDDASINVTWLGKT